MLHDGVVGRHERLAVGGGVEDTPGVGGELSDSRDEVESGPVGEVVLRHDAVGVVVSTGRDGRLDRIGGQDSGIVEGRPQLLDGCRPLRLVGVDAERGEFRHDSRSYETTRWEGDSSVAVGASKPVPGRLTAFAPKRRAWSATR